jgi:hypothetical protein
MLVGSRGPFEADVTERTPLPFAMLVTFYQTSLRSIVACTVKSRPGLALTPKEREEEEKKLVVLPTLGCLATYIAY